MNNRYILMRHGETKYQAEGKDYYLYAREEQMVLSITEEAKKTVESKAVELKEKKIDIIYSSDYLRTKQTAEIVSQITNAKVILDKRLRDIDFGVFSGGDSRNFKEYFSSKMQRFSVGPPEGESWGDVRIKLLEVFEEIEANQKGKTVLIITHGDPFWLLIGILKGLSDEELLNIDFYPKPGQYLDLSVAY
jgi:broad specificity phosphatase PhoE